jgi:malonyl-CoA O-methyltransferase
VRALAWIDRHSVPQAGIAQTDRRPQPYPEVTGYLIPTLIQMGERERALSYACWLTRVQSPEGWIPGPDGRAYTFDTGQALKGFLACLDWMPDLAANIRRAADWIVSQVRSTGEVTTPHLDGWTFPDGSVIPPEIQVNILPPLGEAGKRLGELRYLRACDQGVAFYMMKPDLVQFATLSHFHAYVLEGLADLGLFDLARQGMEQVKSHQRKDGAVPARPGIRWVCVPALAQYAVIWYRLGDREPADRAMRFLERVQSKSGGFHGSVGFGATYSADEEVSWAIKYFLDAYYWRTKAAFNAEAHIHPATIANDDGRIEAILQGLRPRPGDKILDAGCGKGRIAAALMARATGLEITGVDLSEEMLCYVPREIATRCGSLLNLPFPDGAFDGAYCVEALEHVGNHQGAVRELCRVVRPGGRVVIVDKDARKLGAIRLAPGEQWFQRQDVSRWLSEHCVEVRVLDISPVNGHTSEGLFVAWAGRRK